MAETQPRLPLRLSFDVNETIVMLDSSGGKTLKECISTSVAARALGTTTGDGADAAWHWDGAIPGKDAAHAGAGTGKLTYKDWVGSLSTLCKKQRASKVCAFLDSGQHSERLTELGEELLSNLRLPTAERPPGELSAPSDTSDVCLLVPGFLRLIRDLTEEGRDFSVAFRTFGCDLPKVAKDWNRFCDGAHPLHPGFSLPPSRRFDLLDRERVGYLWRNSSASGQQADSPEEDVALIVGCAELAPGTDSDGWGCTTPSAALEWYEKQEGVRILRGLEQVRDFFETSAREGRTVGIRECYPNWASHGFAAVTGKLHFADVSSSPQYHAIFLDDNIEDPGTSGKGIVATRDIAKPTVALPYREAEEVFMLRVDPFELVLDDAYLGRRIASAEERLALRSASGASEPAKRRRVHP